MSALFEETPHFQQPDEAESARFDLSGALQGLRRQLVPMVVVAAVIGAVGIGAAVGLPPVYQSTATILIEQQVIPDAFVRSTVTSFAAERIQVISQRVMTSSNLLDIANKYKLYDDQLGKEPDDVIVGLMRGSVDLEMVNTGVRTRGGGSNTAAIAFKLSYKNREAAVAQQVASELTTLYLNQNLRTRTAHAAETSDFLADEADKFLVQLQALEGKISEFKAQNAGALPEQAALNRSVLETTERGLAELTWELRSLESRKVSLEAQLALAKDQAGGSPETMSIAERHLAALEAERDSLLVSFTAKHPDVIRINRTIEQLTLAQNDGSPTNDNFALSELRAQLDTARGRYGKNHPEVARLEGIVAEISAGTVSAGAAASTIGPRSFIMTLEAQLRDADTRQAIVLERLKKHREKLSTLQERTAGAPEVERAFRELNRDYGTAAAKYKELKAKQQEARLSESLESERKGERFTVVEPARRPSQPIEPNRPALVLLSLLLAIGCGGGAGFAREALDGSVRDEKPIVRIFGVGPLGVIPYVESRQVRRRLLRKRVFMAVVMLVIVVGALTAVHIYFRPLDHLVLGVLRRLGMY